MADKTKILDRIKEYFSLNTNKDLADFLGVSKQTISNWYNRNTIDYDIVISRCTDIDFKIDLKWLLCGKSDDFGLYISRFQKHTQEIDISRFDDAWFHRFEKYDMDRTNTINSILKKAHYSERATMTQNLIADIFNIVDYAKDNSIEYNLDKLYELLKKKEISIDVIEKNLHKLVLNDIKLYNKISPYQRELKALNALILLESYASEDED